MSLTKPVHNARHGLRGFLEKIRGAKTTEELEKAVTVAHQLPSASAKTRRRWDAAEAAARLRLSKTT